MPSTTITLKFKMCLFWDEASYWVEKLLTDLNLPPLMSDEDNNVGDSLVLDFRKWWSHVQPKNTVSKDNHHQHGKIAYLWRLVQSTVTASYSWSSVPELILLIFLHSHQDSTRDEQVIVNCFDSWITCCSFLLGSCCPWKASVILLFALPAHLRWSLARPFHLCPSQTPHASHRSEIDSSWQFPPC